MRMCGGAPGRHATVRPHGGRPHERLALEGQSVGRGGAAHRYPSVSTSPTRRAIATACIRFRVALSPRDTPPPLPAAPPHKQSSTGAWAAAACGRLGATADSAVRPLAFVTTTMTRTRRGLHAPPSRPGNTADERTPTACAGHADGTATHAQLRHSTPGMPTTRCHASAGHTPRLLQNVTPSQCTVSWPGPASRSSTAPHLHSPRTPALGPPGPLKVSHSRRRGNPDLQPGHHGPVGPTDAWCGPPTRPHRGRCAVESARPPPMQGTSCMADRKRWCATTAAAAPGSAVGIPAGSHRGDCGAPGAHACCVLRRHLPATGEVLLHVVKLLHLHAPVTGPGSIRPVARAAAGPQVPLADRAVHERRRRAAAGSRATATGNRESGVGWRMIPSPQAHGE